MAEVLRLRLTEGKSIHAIHRATGLDRKTVRRLLGLAKGKRQSKPERQRSSIVAPYDADIRKLLADCADIRAPAVLERLRSRGYQGGITVVRDRLRQLRPRPKQEAFFKRSYGPGRMLQVDWADFGYAIAGCARRVSAFVAALAYSRYLFLVFTLSQAMGCFLRCMDQALSFFGGRTLLDVFDNMGTVVKERSGQTVVFNARFLEYARIRGLGVQACTPKRPTEKPYVERPIGFVRTRFWPGRHFGDLFNLNVQGAKWRDDIANNRIHEETGKVPSLVFRNEEQKKLQPILDHYFDTDDLESTGVSKTFRVIFDRNAYTVPWRLVSQSVLVRGNEQEVSVFLGPKRVAVHNRCWGVGEDIRDPSHEQGLLEQKPRAAAGALPPELVGLGDVAASYFKILAANGRSLRKEIQRLVLLSELYGDSATRASMEEVMATGHVGAEYVEYVLRYKKGLSPVHTLKLGNEELDGIRLAEPDLCAYDIPRKTLDPGDPPAMEPPDET
ncbi:MAG TPA: IS21 family transposase [Myxococcaceae bacterium]|nr:IS21 family transposase [Myxococcaceae bacterium]